MIQRKQTIYLILSALSFVLLFIFPFANFPLGTELICNISILGIQDMPLDSTNYLFFIMQVLATGVIALTGVSVFMYTKRPLQIRLCAFAFIVNILIIGAMFLTSSVISNELRLPEHTPVNYLFPTYIPMVTLILIMMAQRAIRKDEAMVQSLNRLR
ncbi:MAG: DUF4293 domain-containing protein [Bacteroidales bacterium]|jgi:hypothetical protein|nr:DUF4293 domain-containing protein [Bacteroidales bacterium]